MSADGHLQALQAGTRIGDYTIERVLGVGGFAITYAVTGPGGEALALKELFPAGLVTRTPSGAVVPVTASRSAEFDARAASFAQEAELLARLSHPGVVRVTEGFKANGTAYFAMTRYDGPTVAEAARTDGEGARDMARGLLGALEYIHGQNVFHRDIKPANIILSENLSEPVLIDFGAAKQAVIDGTQVQTRIGTENYRAPEQLSGSGHIGPWTDIYGLAGTLYFAICGDTPVDAGTRQDAVFNGRIDPLPSLLAQPELVSAHGETFLTAVMAGLAIKSSDRPQSVADWKRIFAGGTLPRPTPAPGGLSSGAAAPANTAPHRPATGAPPPLPGGYAPYQPEPERSPWGRYLAGLVLLAVIAGAGLWLASQSMGPATDDAGEMRVAEEATDPVPAPPPRTTDDEAWVRALEQDTLEGYRGYLEQFPDGRHADDAQAQIDRYDNDAWARAEQRDTIAGYEDYLADWPDGLHAGKARERIAAMEQAAADAAEAAAERARQEAADWAAAARENTISGYDAYLGKHPTGPNAPEARTRRDRLAASEADNAAFAQAQALNTVAAYEQYLQSFPRGAHAMAAVAAIEAMRPAPGRKFQDCPQCPIMVTLPTGTAELGAPDADASASPAEKPRRPVTFAGFVAIAETEVTFDQYRACVSAGGCARLPSDNGWGGGNRPVINVTWADAVAYADWLSRETGQAYSLPSEAQWEYAARGGEAGVFVGGSQAAVCAFANGAASESGLQWANAACADPAPDRTLPAGALAANGFGVKDMIGNVAEWTMDCNTLNLRDAPTDGGADLRGSCGQRAVRGGSWFSGPKDLRFTARMMQRRGDSNDFTGFRVVRPVEPRG